MSMPWISSFTSLPRTGSRVRFVIDDRKIPMEGTYDGGVFRSRWGEYDVGCVHVWCALDTHPIVVATAVVTPQSETLVTLLKWLSELLTKHRDPAAKPAVTPHLKTDAVLVSDFGTKSSIGWHADSNQMSS